MAISATEPGDSVTTMGKFSRNQMLSIAELQSDMIGDGWREAQAYRLMNGLPHNGGPRFGYVITDEGFYVPKPIRSEALAEVYEAYVSGHSFRMVADDMAKSGVRAPNGDVLSTSRWLNIMDTGFAAGLIRKRKPDAGKSRRFDQWEWIQGAHEPIITPDLWQAFYDKRMASAGSPRKSGKAKYSVSGLLKCGKCLRLMTAGKKANGAILFRCVGMNTKECSGVSVMLTTIEEAVMDWLEAKAQTLDTIEGLAQAEAASRSRDVEIKDLKRKIELLDVKLSRLLDLYEDGGLDKAEYNRRKADREAERSKLRLKLYELEEEQKRSVVIPAEFYASLRQTWPEISHDRKRQMLKQVLDHAVVHPRGYVGPRVEFVPREFAA